MEQENPGNEPADKLQPTYEGTIPDGDQLDRESIREQIKAMFAAMIQDDLEFGKEAYEIRPIYEPTSKTNPAAKASERERHDRYSKYSSWFPAAAILNDKHCDKLLNILIEASNDQTNIFIGVNPRSERLDGTVHGCTEDIKKVWFLHADVDNTGPEEVFNALKAKDFYPTLIIRSSKNSGCHVWLRLKTPIDTSTKEGAELATNLNRRLSLLFGKKTDGKGGDSTHDIARVLRLPGLWNWPNKAKREKGREKDKSWLWRAYKTAYDWTQFDNQLPELPPKAQVDVSSLDLSLDEAGRLKKALPYWNAICQKPGSFVGMSTNGLGNRSCEYVRILAWDFGLPVKKAIAMIRERNGEVLDDENYWEQYIQRECEGPFGNKLGTLKTEEKSKMTLPPIVKLKDRIGVNLRPKLPDVWLGVARQRCKLFIAAPSKIGKTWTLIAFGLAVANGRAFWDIPTTQGKVLYLNFELEERSFEHRANSIIDALKFPLDNDNFDVWHLRGYCDSIDNLREEIAKRAETERYDVIIVDPGYSCIGNRDENSAGDISSFCNQLENIATRTGSMICMALHFAKGNSSGKDAIDRAAGSGVWGRNPDTLMSLTPHEVDGAYTVSFSLRDHPKVDEFVVQQDFPLFKRVQLDPTMLKKQKSSQEAACSKEDAFEHCTSQMKRSELKDLLIAECEINRARAYAVIKEAEKTGWLSDAGKGEVRRGQVGLASNKWAKQEVEEDEPSFFGTGLK